MKDKLDLLVIYVSYIIELSSIIIIKYSDYLYVNNPIIRVNEIIINNSEIYVVNCLGRFLFQVFYFLIILYIVIIAFMHVRCIVIKLKRNTILLFVLLICDMALRLFDIGRIFKDSNTFLFSIICLLTNLVVYIKYKKNNIKIE